MTAHRFGLVALSVLVCGPALAADIPPVPPAPAPVFVEAARPYDLIIELGGGVQVRPDYPGAKTYEVWPTGFVVFLLMAWS